MKYLRGRLIKAKYIIFNRGIRSSFETYRHHFYRFDNLAFDFIETIFAKIQLAFESFLQNRDFYVQLAINEKYYTYVTTTKR